MIYKDTPYDTNFYETFQDRSASSAQVIAKIILSLFPIHSVVDVGCGVGTWLHAFAKNGVNDFLGIDGPYVSSEMLRVPSTNFREADLTELTSIGRRFDLACSLEVAEHLPEKCAAQFVTLLTDAAPIVMFSAAVPHQGGNRHINEQWQSYWMDLFADRGYKPFDCVRPLVYENQSVEWWYRQNTIIYCDNMHKPSGIEPLEGPFAANRVDPGMIDTLYGEISRLATQESIRGSISALGRDLLSLRRSLARKIYRTKRSRNQWGV